jgi:two-component system response regulator PilR (NtrC family)
METGYPVPHLTPQQLSAIAALPLEGNVRELENLLQRAIALGDESRLQLDTTLAAAELEPATESPGLSPPFPPLSAPAPAAPARAPAASDGPLPADLSKWLDEQERQVLVKALEETGFNRTAAAAKLGLNLRQIRYRMARLNITAPGHDDDA